MMLSKALNPLQAAFGSRYLFDPHADFSFTVFTDCAAGRHSDLPLCAREHDSGGGQQFWLSGLLVDEIQGRMALPQPRMVFFSYQY